MGRQGDTVDTLLKLLDEEAIAETCGSDDGTYRAIVFTTEELRSFFAYYPVHTLKTNSCNILFT